MNHKIRTPIASPLKSSEKLLRNERIYTLDEGQITPAVTPPVNYEPRRHVKETLLIISPKPSPLKTIERSASPPKKNAPRIRTSSELSLRQSETELLLSTQIRLPKLENLENLLSSPLDSPTTPTKVDAFSPNKIRTLNRVDSIVIAPTASPLRVLERSRSLIMGTDIGSPGAAKHKVSRMHTASLDSAAMDNRPALERSVSYRQPEAGEVEMVWDYQLKTFVVVAPR